MLGAEDREELAERIVRDSVGLGPLEELLADPTVEEVMVNGPAASTSSAAARIEATEVAVRRRGGAAQRDRADPGAARAGGSTSSARWSTPGSPTARGSTW